MGVMRVEKSAESDLRYSVIGSMRCECIELESRPSRARGLKHVDLALPRVMPLVAPLAGAWVETGFGFGLGFLGNCRAPRGRVG